MAHPSVHPTALIEPTVRLGAGVTIGPFVRIEGDVEVGDDCWIAAGCVVGALPEVRGLGPDDGADIGGVTIGARTFVREYSQIHRGWRDRTVVGEDCLVLNQSYLAHDVHLGDRVVLSSSVLLAGHVKIGSDSNLGMGVTVHQHRVVGDGAMIGMGAVVVRDVPPWSKSMGNPARVRGANLVGLRRRGFDEETVSIIDVSYRTGAHDDALRAISS